jgi:hypothetical protein
MKIHRSDICGCTDYIGADLKDLIEDLDKWKNSTQKTLSDLGCYHTQTISNYDKIDDVTYISHLEN